MLANRNQPEMEQSKTTDANQKLRVHYFYIRGKCQPIRNLLYHLEIDFEDIMHQKNSEVQVQVGFNMGLPMLEDDGLKIHDAVAIMVYICRKFSEEGLIGFTPQQKARVQQVLMKYSLQRNRIFSIIIQSLRASRERDGSPQFYFKKLLSECKFVQFCLKEIGKSKKFVLNILTLVDFVFYEICYYICGFYQDYIENHPTLKYFLFFKHQFQTLDFFNKNKNKIEQKYVFLQFSNERLNLQIENAWKGSKQKLIKRDNSIIL